MKNSATFADKIIAFNASLKFNGSLPEHIAIMNPFKENDCAAAASEAFYKKYYNDQRPRFAILGINPGRFGAGITGVPFTDPIRLKDPCGITISSCPEAREPSSVFVYEIIKAYGGVKEFYKDWYINSICPLGFIKEKKPGRWVNYNYYDSAALLNAATPFILHTLPEQIACGLHKTICFCFGKDKNSACMRKFNAEGNFFEKIVPLEHPRYIAQYKSSEMKDYALKYAKEFKKTVLEFS